MKCNKCKITTPISVSQFLSWRQLFGNRNPVGNLLSDVWTHWLICRCNTGCSFVVSFNSQTSKKTMTQWIQTIPEVLKDRCRPQGMELPGWIPDRCDPRDQDQWITQVRHSGYISYIYKLGPVNHPGGKTFSNLLYGPNNDLGVKAFSIQL